MDQPGKVANPAREDSKSFVCFEMSLFPNIFCTITVLSLYGKYVVRSLLPDGVFLPCDHGLDFLHQLM